MIGQILAHTPGVTVGIEIAPPTASAHRLTQAGAISLPGLSALPGFASLLNGLVDQNANAIITASAGRESSTARNAPFPFRLLNRSATVEPTAGKTAKATAPLTKPAQRKAGAAAGLPDETQTLLPAAVGEQTRYPVLAGLGGKDSTSIVSAQGWTSLHFTPLLPPQPGHSALPPTTSATGTPSQAALAASSASGPFTEMAPTAGDLAFSLQLSWQPPSVHPSAAPPWVSGVTAPPAPEASLSIAVGASTVGASPLRDAEGGRARASAAANIPMPYYAQGPQHEPSSPAPDAQPREARASVPAMRSTDSDAPIREELVSQARSEALFHSFSSTRASSPAETASLGKSFSQIAGSNATLDAASATDTGEVPAQTEEANFLPARLPDKTSARTEDRPPEPDPAEPGSHAPVDKSTPSTYPLASGGDKQTSQPPRLRPGSALVNNAPANHPAIGPSAEDSESAAPAGAGAKPGAKAPEDLPVRKLSPSPGRHESPLTSAEEVLLGRSADQAGTPPGRTKAAAPEMPQTRPVARTEAAPARPAPAIRELSIRLEAATSTSVDVQLAAKAGKVQVAVRTPDPDLAKSLQTNLAELVGRLEEKGFKTEVWTPPTAMHSGLAVRQPATSTANQGHSDQAGSPGGQADARGGQRQSGQRQQGRWAAEFEETLAAPDATPPASD